jgi:hypothetical protein
MNYDSKQAHKGHFRNIFPMNWGFGRIEFGFFGMSFGRNDLPNKYGILRQKIITFTFNLFKKWDIAILRK